MSNCIHYEMWKLLIYCTVEVWEWLSNLSHTVLCLQYLSMLRLKLIHVSKRDPYSCDQLSALYDVQGPIPPNISILIKILKILLWSDPGCPSSKLCMPIWKIMCHFISWNSVIRKLYFVVIWVLCQLFFKLNPGHQHIPKRFLKFS